MQAFSDVEKCFFFSDFGGRAPNSESKKGFSMSERDRISSQINRFY